MCFLKFWYFLSKKLFKQKRMQILGLGWADIMAIVYTTAWALSFYGQIIVNYRLKSVEGMSINFLIFNLNGFLFYSLYLSIGYFTNLKGVGTVMLEDLLFAYHSVAMILILAYQSMIYPRGNNQASAYSYLSCLGLWLFLGFNDLLTYLGYLDYGEFWNPVSLTGYCKIVLSFVKYTPAVYWNFKRKSTEGWSIAGVVLDFIGGSFSLISGEISVEQGFNVSKIALAVLSIFFDIIFMIQHFVLYRKPAARSHEILEDQMKEVSQRANSKNEMEQNESSTICETVASE